MNYKNVVYMKYNRRIKKFIVVGLSSALVNLFLTSFFIEVLGFKSYYLKNLANILSIEITIIYHFFLTRAWAWGDIPKKRGKSLLGQLIYFHFTILIGILLRIVLFAALEKEGVSYILNVVIGIVLFAMINFVLYDRVVFRKNI